MAHKDPAKRREYMRKYRAENSKDLKEYHKNYFQMNKEEKSVCRQKWREANPGKERPGQIEYAVKNATAIRTKQLSQYGITIEEYDRMEKEQNGVCWICEKKCSTGMRLSVDHNHSTQKVRGLLCQRCNRGIGAFFDSIGLLQKCVQYLTEKDK